MSWSLDRPTRAGGITCVPIVDMVATVNGGLSHIAVHGGKRPVLILVFSQGEVDGIDLSGRRLDVKTIEARYPGAIKRAEALVAEGAR